VKNAGSRIRIVVWTIFFVLFLLFSNSGGNIVLAVDNTESNKQELKNKIDALRNQIEKYQQDIFQKNQREESIANDIEVLEVDIKKIELQIQETELTISQLNMEISAKQLEVQDMQKKVDERKIILTKFLQDIYERADNVTAGIIFGNQSFSDYFFQAESLESFENQAKEVFDQLVFLRDGLKKQKDDLLGKREEKENMRYIQVDQENSLKQEREMKDLLVAKIQNEKEALTQGMEKMQAELSVLQSLGEPIVLEEAVKAAKYASNLTKVAPEFLLGVLRVESGLGTNVGGGRYKTDMNPAQWDTFKNICKELGIDPNSTPVSRRACYNRDSGDGCGGWGGAMGPAQFMPSTWMGYKSKVEKTTGEVPANPWDIRDSLVAMGLKLAAVDGVTSGDRKAWAKAAGMYLAGGNWENYPWYSDRVLFYADSFKKIIKS
jgi:peptidoglycan hydrolase CwlO-like protein